MSFVFSGLLEAKPQTVKDVVPPPAPKRVAVGEVIRGVAATRSPVLSRHGVLGLSLREHGRCMGILTNVEHVQFTGYRLCRRPLQIGMT